MEAVKIINTETLGKQIREKRQALNLTLEATAGLCGVGFRFLSELERGKNTSEIGKVLQVLTRLGLELYLFEKGKSK